MIKLGWQRSMMQKACRWNLSRVKDSELREKLTPDYEPMCKRLVMSVDFYPAVSRPSVKLVREGIASVDPDGVTDTAGVKHPLDVLILATGFDTRAYFRPMSVFNENGVPETWTGTPDEFRDVLREWNAEDFHVTASTSAGI